MEYKFRGKSKRTNEWVYGSYHCCNREGSMRFVDYKDGNRVVEDKAVTFNSHWILVHQTPDTVGWDIRDTFIPHEVYPESVGMWSGWNDKNGSPIYQDDMLRGIMHEQDRDNNMDRTEQVMFDRGGFTVFNKAMQNGRGTGKGVLDCFMWFDPGSNGHRDQYWQIDNIEVVGNIHELTPAKGAVNYNMNNNIDPNAPKEQATEDPAAINAAEDQAHDALGEPEQSAEEGTTEG